MNACAAPVARAVARRAALLAIKHGHFGGRNPILSQFVCGRLVGHLALFAEHPHQPLRQHRRHRSLHPRGLDPHVEQPGDRGRRVVGMDRGEDEMAGDGRLHGDLGRLLVADLAHQDHVRILP